MITGSKGMLGQDLALHLAARHEVLPLDRSDADITDYRTVGQAIASRSPDAPPRLNTIRTSVSS